MTKRKFFLIWTLGFGALGVAVPLILKFGFRGNFGTTEFLLWPSSIMLMALDTPAPAAWSTVVIIYAVAIAENALLYAVIGAVMWPLAYVIQLKRTKGHRRHLTGEMDQRRGAASLGCGARKLAPSDSA